MYNSDGVLTFSTGAFAPGVTVERATYRMWAIDAGMKWDGLAVNGQYFFRWVDDFAAARNVALDLATGDYVFWLDADDRLDAANRMKLKALFASLDGSNVAYVLKCRCLIDRPGGTPTVVDHVRLFPRRPDVRWEHRVHEQVLPALRRAGTDVRWSDVIVDHVGYVDPAVRKRRARRCVCAESHSSAKAPATRKTAYPAAMTTSALMSASRPRPRHRSPTRRPPARAPR